MQANYSTYEVGLFSNSYRCLGSSIEDKKYASRDLIPTIEKLLTDNNLSLKDVDAIGVNQGPGPFTSLRVIITTANGLALATKIPLIGINSLEALLDENPDSQWPITIALLNAYNNDLYFGIQSPAGMEFGCENAQLLIKQVKDRFSDVPIRFLGNGVTLYQNEILQAFGYQAHIPNPVPEGCSLIQLAFMTDTAFSQNERLSEQLLPIYLKNLRYALQI